MNKLNQLQTEDGPSKAYASACAWAFGEFPELEEIRDARKPIKFEVTPADVKKAVCRDGNKCVFALAFMEHEKKDQRIVGVAVTRTIAVAVYERTAVGARRARGRKLLGVRFRLPHKERAALADFDVTGEIEVGNYTFGPVYKSQSFEGRDQRGAERGPHTKKKDSPIKRVWTVKDTSRGAAI